METVTRPAESRPAPLLPAPLLHPASFLWLWILPVAILGLLNLQGYWLIGSEMDPGQRGRALLLGWATLANLLGGAAVFHFAKTSGKDPAHPLWGLPGLLCQIAYLWLAISSLAEGMLPANVTAWIYPESRYAFNQFTFCMLPAFHGLLRLAAARPPAMVGRTLAVSAGVAIAAPILLYTLLNTLSVFGSNRGGSWVPYFIATLVIVTGALMFFGLLRLLLLALRLARGWHATAERWAVVFLALVLPLAGLTLNITIPFPVDFQATEVYVLTVANALVLLFAVWAGEKRPRLSWHLLCATLPFALYFFIVFLPFTPLSVLAVIAVGTGVLVLTPTLLFALHLYLLTAAWRRTATVASRRSLLLGGALAVLVLPAFFTVRGLADKAALNAALDYLYEPAVPRGDVAFGSSLTNLRRAVNSHRSYKEGLYYPLLSDYYAWLVFDNLVLPDAKLAEIERTFFGAPQVAGKMDPFSKDHSVWGRGQASDRHRVRRGPPPPQTVTEGETGVRFAAVDARDTTVTLTLTLHNTGGAAAEFVKQLSLPAGVFVSGFRLQVGDTLVPGRIFEKKTALWVYTMIRDSERRDPGLLVYRSPTELELRVFPVLVGKPVKVEIDLLVPGKITAQDLAQGGGNIDSLFAAIGRTVQPVIWRNSGGDAAAAGLEIRHLPTVEREPYLHLIVDRSETNGFDGNFAAVRRALQAKFPDAKRIRITAANFEVTTLCAELTPWENVPAFGANELKRMMPRSGGLALDLALAHAIRLHRDRDLDGQAASGIPPRPIFVIVGRKAVTRSMDLPLTVAWQDMLPGLEVCELGVDDGSFVSLRHEGSQSTPLLRAGNSVRPAMPDHLVRFSASGAAGSVQYWDSAVSSWKTVDGATAVAGESRWSQAIGLQVQQQDHDRSPRDAGVDLRGLVAASRQSGILLASGSYIVVENQAQWKMLESGERQKLGQNQALDFVETPAPPAWWIAIAFVAWLVGRSKQIGRKKAQEAISASDVATVRL